MNEQEINDKDERKWHFGRYWIIDEINKHLRTNAYACKQIAWWGTQVCCKQTKQMHLFRLTSNRTRSHFRPQKQMSPLSLTWKLYAIIKVTSKYLNCNVNNERVILFTSFYEVRVLRALNRVPECSSLNSSEVLMRPINIPKFAVFTFIIKRILCFLK